MSALAKETLYVAVEEFLDCRSEADDELGRDVILKLFGMFLEDLGTQPATITISSLVWDMLELYWERPELHFPCRSDNLEGFVKSFILSQDCFFFPEGCAPAIEVTFPTYRVADGELDLHVCHGWVRIPRQSRC